MSTTVDQRVVEMQFDNKRFEENVSTTMSTLDSLNKKLNLTGASKGLEDVGEAAKRIDLSGLSGAADAVSVKFSYLQATLQHQLNKIVDSAVAAGKRIVMALTIDPIKSGFQEYETQINAVQTILANTSSKGKTIKDVNAALDELNAYADKTIYNFTEMTRNIGTFTAAGVDLDTSVQAIKGIANLAAVSGSTSQQASTAMYQLSQALSSGTVKLQDWNSVTNAGMGGQVFQDALKDTARVHGIAIDEMIDKEGSFRETLKNGWLSAEILTETLSKFTGDLTEEQLKTMGYTDEQIESIVKMGQTANDAATKVKTFTQLFDTLKEAAQSGWTQSWEIIVGDFEEAKELLTEISDVFGAIIGKSAESRNEMLQGWKDLGGRTALVEALRNTFEGLMSIITPIKEAFTEIFPPITAEQLYAFTKGLKELTARFKLSDEQSARLKSTFKGLFAILNIVKQAFVAVWNVIKPLFGGIGKLGDGILGVTASWGDWLSNLNETIERTDIFNKVLQNFAKYIRTGIAKVTDFLSPAIQAIKQFVSSVKEKIQTKGFELFHAVLSRVNTKMEETGKAVGEMKSGFTTAIKAMGETLVGSKFVKAMLAIWEAVKIIAGGIMSAIGGMVDGLIGSLQNANFDGILGMINTISFGGIALAITNFIKSITEPISGIGDGIVDILDGVRGCFQAYQEQLKAGTLVKIATAIAILAASIFVISLIDSDKLSTSLIAIGALFGELLTSMALFSKIDKSGKGAIKACAIMITMSISIAILAGALAALSSLDLAGIAKGLIGIAGLSVILTKTMKSLSGGEGKLVKGATSLVIFALAIKVLASACADLGALDFGVLVKGLVGVGALMFAVSKFLNNTKFNSKAMGTATGILILSAAIKVLASACGDLGGMSIDKLAKGLGAIAILLAELVVFTKFTGGAKNMLSTGVALIAIAAAMKIFASAVGDLGSMKAEELAKGLIAMAGALAMITVAVNFMPSNIIGIGVGLIAVGAALLIVASAMSKLGGMSWEGIGKGLIAIGSAIAILAIGLHAMTGAIAGSAALLVAAAALAVLAPVLCILGAMSWEGVAKGLVAIAGAIAILGVAGYVLSPIIGPILALAGALALIGVSILAAGTGLVIAGAGINALAIGIAALAAAVAGGATAIVAGLTVIIVGVIKLIPAILVEVGKAIVALCNVIADGVPAICIMVTKVLLAVIKALKECVPPLLELVGIIIEELLKLIVTYVPKIVDAALKLIVALLEGIADNIDDIVLAAVDVIIAFVKGLYSAIPRIVDAGYQIIIDLINGMADTIRKNNPLLIAAVDNLMDAILTAIAEWFMYFGEKGAGIVDSIIGGIFGKEEEGKKSVGSVIGSFVQSIKDTFDEWKTAGKDTIAGFVQGVKDGFNNAKESVLQFGRNVIAWVKDVLGIHSPSTIFADIGKYTIQGFINGMGSMFSSVGKKAKEIVSNAISAVTGFVDKFKTAGKNLIGNIVTGFNDKLSTVKEKAVSIASSAKSAISNWAANFRSAGSNLIGNVASGIGSMVGEAKAKASSVASSARTAISNWASSFKSTARNLISNVVSGFGDKLKSIKDKASSLASSAKTAVSNWYSSFKSTGGNLVSGLITGIGDKASSLVKKAKGVVGDAIQAAKNLLGIHSPSKVFAKMGRYVDEGFIVGLESFAGKVSNATGDVGRGAMDAMSNAIAGASNLLSDDVGGPVIRPVLDLSQIQAGSSRIGGLFGQQTVALNGVLGGNIGEIANLTAQLDKINQNGNADVVDAIATLRGDVSDLAEAVTKMRIVMDSGTVVGELLPQIDSGLGRKVALSGRGN